jgi:hypothetical protein
MVKTSTVFLFIGIFLLILFLAILIGMLTQNVKQTADISPPPTVYTWGDESKGPDPNKNTCQVYKFEGQNISINGKMVYISPNPTFDRKVLDEKQGEPLSSHKCLLPGYIEARQVQHTCMNRQGGVDPQGTSQCWTFNEGKVDVGETEIFYTDRNCAKIPPCQGVINTITFGTFNHNYPNQNVCLSNNNPTISTQCNPKESDNMFLINRIMPGGTSATSDNNSQNGPLAKITSINDNYMNYCLSIGTTMNQYQYIKPNFSVTGFPGYDLVLDQTCKLTPGMIEPGYNWLICGNTSIKFSTLYDKKFDIPYIMVWIQNLDISKIPFYTPYKNYSIGQESLMHYFYDMDNVFVYGALQKVGHSNLSGSVIPFNFFIDILGDIYYDEPIMEYLMDYTSHFQVQTMSINLWNSLFYSSICNPYNIDLNCYVN